MTEDEVGSAKDTRCPEKQYLANLAVHSLTLRAQHRGWEYPRRRTCACCREVIVSVDDLYGAVEVMIGPAEVRAELLASCGNSAIWGWPLDVLLALRSVSLLTPHVSSNLCHGPKIGMTDSVQSFTTSRCWFNAGVYASCDWDEDTVQCEGTKIHESTA